MSYKDKNTLKLYHKIWDKQRYEQHKEEILARNSQWSREIADWFREYKKTLCCIACGICHPAALQFRHRHRTDKSFSVSDVVRRGYSIKRIMSEIEKCDVLCVNCHAKLHWRETHETDSWEEILLEDK